MISVHSDARPAWQAFREGRYVLCVSDEILNEYQEILSMVANSAVATNITQAILHSPHTELLNPYYHFNLIEQDPDDNKFVDCAIQAGADYIVSEDSHFRHLKDIGFPKVLVIKLAEFLSDLGL